MSLNIQLKFMGLITFVGSLGNEIKARYEKNHWPRGKPARMHTALDDLYSLEKKESERKDKGLSSDLFSKSEDNNAVDGNESESSGNGTRFAHRTGVFSLDFPPSPKVPKGKGKKSTENTLITKKNDIDVDSTDLEFTSTVGGKQVMFRSPNLKQRESDSSSTDSESTTVLGTATQSQDLTLCIHTVPNSDSDVLIQPSGFITTRKHKRKSSSSRDKENVKRCKMSESSGKCKGYFKNHSSEIELSNNIE